jgi:hypothetical protein
VEDRRTLRQDLDTLQKCEDQWLMQLHPDKCKDLQITPITHYSPIYPRTGTKQRQLRQVPGFEHPCNGVLLG